MFGLGQFDPERKAYNPFQADQSVNRIPFSPPFFPPALFTENLSQIVDRYQQSGVLGNPLFREVTINTAKRKEHPLIKKLAQRLAEHLDQASYPDQRKRLFEISQSNEVFNSVDLSETRSSYQLKKTIALVLKEINRGDIDWSFFKSYNLKSRDLSREVFELADLYRELDLFSEKVKEGSVYRLTNLSRAFAKLGYFDEAIEILNTKMEEGRGVSVMIDIYTIAKEQGKELQAQKILDQYIKITKNNAENDKKNPDYPYGTWNIRLSELYNALTDFGGLDKALEVLKLMIDCFSVSRGCTLRLLETFTNLKTEGNLEGAKKVAFAFSDEMIQDLMEEEDDAQALFCVLRERGDIEKAKEVALKFFDETLIHDAFQDLISRLWEQSDYEQAKELAIEYFESIFNSVNEVNSSYPSSIEKGLEIAMQLPIDITKFIFLHFFSVIFPNMNQNDGSEFQISLQNANDNVELAKVVIHSMTKARNAERNVSNPERKMFETPKTSNANRITFPISHIYNPKGRSFLGRYVQLNDGSLWLVDLPDRHKVLDWSSNDQIRITPSEVRSPYNYVLENITRNEKVKAK